MKCYNCGKNEANHRFLVNIMGHGAEVHLCAECLDGFANYASHMMQQGGQDGPSFPQGWSWLGNKQPEPRRVVVRRPVDDPFPWDAGKGFRRRRRVEELRAGMWEAVQREEYEEAARIRDEIAKIEEGILV